MNGHPGLAALLGLLLLSAGCATTPVPPDDGRPDPAGTDPSAASAEAPTTTPEVAPAPSSDGATLALLDQSERAASSGSLADALSYAERAVRIDPRSPQLWTHLATLELANGNPTTAIQHASKAITLARSRPDWQREAWLVIANAREALGELEAARGIREAWQTVRSADG